MTLPSLPIVTGSFTVRMGNAIGRVMTSFHRSPEGPVPGAGA